MINRFAGRLVGWFLLFAFGGCATISPFDQYAYVHTTGLKAEVLTLMDKATEPFNDHASEVEQVNMQLFKLVEYERHRPKNNITVKMWEQMFRIDSTGKVDETSMIPSFWAKWQHEGRQRSIFIREAKIQVAEGFDLVAGLESKKIQPGDSRLGAFIGNR